MEFAPQDARDDDVEDALATLLPAGAQVVVAYVNARRQKMFKREVWVVRLRIMEGESEGRMVSWWMRALPAGRPVARGTAIATSYVAATGLRPPRDLWRKKPSYWLSDARFCVRTRQVRKDTHGVERPESASYSVVEAILGRMAGAPPALRERGR